MAMDCLTPGSERPPLDPRRRPGFLGTVSLIVLSFPLLTWIFLLSRRASDQSPPCQPLFEIDPFISLFVAVILILSVLLPYMFYTYITNKWLAALAFLLLIVSLFLVLDSPDSFPGLVGRLLGDKPALGFIHTHSSSSSSSEVVVAGANKKNSNNSEYWNNNIKACVCKNEACEDMVYRHYLVDSHNDSFFEGVVNFPIYTRVFDDDDDYEVGRQGLPAAHDLNGTSLKNGYHKVCYTGWSMGKGNLTLCYDCHACEENYLSDRKRTWWIYSNHLVVMMILLIVSYLVLFLSELWARYVTWEGDSQTNEKPKPVA